MAPIHLETPLIESLPLGRWLKMEALQPCGSVPHVVTDREAVQACLSFADDHRLVVEPACGAALALAYERVAALEAAEDVLLVVCGGAGVTYRELIALGEALA